MFTTYYNVKKEKMVLDFYENVKYFLKNWPSDSNVSALGCKILCLLHTYYWKNDSDSWLLAESLLHKYLSAQRDLNPELSANCIDAVNLYINSAYFNPIGKLMTQSWLSGEMRYTSETPQFISLKKKLNNIKDELILTRPTESGDLTNKTTNLLRNGLQCTQSFMKSVIDNPSKSTVLLLYYQSNFVSAEWLKKPEWVKNLQKRGQKLLDTVVKPIVNEIPIVPIPIPGPYCGPDGFKPVAWAVADKWQFPTAQVSFSDTCKRHDSCWGNSKNRKQANECDSVFYKELQEECRNKLTGKARNICNSISSAYYAAVVATNEVRHWEL